jgi:hypothetical protein
VKRRTKWSYSVLYRTARPIVVAILPGDVLEFREHGRRKRWTLAVDTAFRHAVELASRAALADAREKKAAQKKAKGGRRK